MTARTASCPNCGATITFRWSSAVQTTCDYCRSILVRHDVDLEKVGVVSDVLPSDSSPIQLGTEGRYERDAFVVVGRIIYEYDRGAWNEWHLVLGDGSSAWLSDAQLAYAFTVQASNGDEPLPAADALRPGATVTLAGAPFEVTTVTPARYRGVEGELPFEYWDKHTVPFVDLASHDGRFATIDYSESPPLLFLGVPVAYDDLALRNVREFEGWPARG